MTRKLFLLFFIAFIGAMQAQQLRPMGKQAQSFTPYHDFRLGIGAVLFEDFEMSDRFFYDEPPTFSKTIIDFDATTTYRGMVYTNGIINANYTFQANKHLGIGISATHISFFNDIMDAESNLKVGTGVRNRMAIYPLARLTWWRMNGLNFYSEAGFGLGLTTDSETLYGVNNLTMKRFVSAHATILGISAGKNLYFYSNIIGVGNGGYFGLGLGYHFDIKTTKEL